MQVSNDLAVDIPRQAEMFKAVIRPSQQEAIERIAKNTGTALFMDCGTGKTACVLSAIKQGIIPRPVILVAPLRVLASSWPGEIARWADFSDLKYTVVHGNNRESGFFRDADIYGINPEGLGALLRSPAQMERCRAMNVGTIVMDESTAFKNPKATRTRNMAHLLAHLAPRKRVILTGTPNPRSMLDLWAQYFMLDRGDRLHCNFLVFRHRNFVYNYYAGGYDLRTGAREKLTKTLADITHRVALEDVVENIPDTPVKTALSVPLVGASRQLYAQLESDLKASLVDGDVIAANSKYMACMRAASGHYASSDTGETRRLHEAKTDALERIVAECGLPVLVACQFLSDVESVKKRFKCPDALVGKTKPEASADIVRRWNLGDIPVLPIQTALSHGLNLQGVGAAVLVFYNVPDNLEHYEQMIARLHRSGIQQRVVVYHLLATGTIDEACMRRTKRKAGESRRFLSALKEYYNLPMELALDG